MSQFRELVRPRAEDASNWRLAGRFLEFGVVGKPLIGASALINAGKRLEVNGDFARISTEII